jgi:hypothetical protein
VRTEWANETKDYPVEEAYISTNEGCVPFLSLSVFGDFTFLNAKLISPLIIACIFNRID